MCYQLSACAEFLSKSLYKMAVSYGAAMRRSTLVMEIVIVCLAAIFLGCIEQDGEITKPAETELVLSDYPELFEKDVMIVIGNNASGIEIEGADAIVENLFNLTRNMPVIKTDDEITEDELAGHNLILVGGADSNEVLREVYDMTDAMRVTDEYPGAGKGVLEILRNPWDSEKAMLLVAGSDEWGVKAGVETIIDMGVGIQGNTLMVEESSETIVEVPRSIKLKDLEAYNLNDSKISIPKNLYIDSYPSETEGYYIVQFNGPIYEEHKTQVIDLGGKFFGYIPKNAFIVKMNESTKNEVQKLHIIQWVGIYQPAYKVSPILLDKTGNVTLTVLVFGGETITNISHKIESLDGTISVSSDNKLRVLIKASTIPEIANMYEVMYIEEYAMPEITSIFKSEGI